MFADGLNHRRKAFLELMLERKVKDKVLSDEEVEEEFNTMIAAVSML